MQHSHVVKPSTVCICVFIYIYITLWIMLAVASLLRNPRDETAGESFSIIGVNNSDFLDLSGDNLLESINFDDLFDGMENDDHVLPSLEIESYVFGEFSVSGGEESETAATFDNFICNQEEDKVSGSDLGSGSSKSSQGDEIVNKRDNKIVATKVLGAHKDDDGKRKSSKNHQGKRKVKVDWTPELHRRFVQAVEQLGVDKAVPSRILELMGIDGLTRHNIASHLQKYRSHRKHLLAREAEAASWTQRRQAYGAATGGGGGCKKQMTTSPWLVPTIGFPPVAPNMPPPHFRPLHVWGHPSMEQAQFHVWPPKHLAHSPNPPSHMWPSAAPSPHIADPSLWHSRHRITQIPGAHPFPPSNAPTRFAAAAVPPVPGIPPHAIYKVDPTISGSVPSGQSCTTPHRPPLDLHPTKESIDAAIEDVLTKPWLPLPLGLKAPSTDSVVVELHRQGVEKIPPTCT